MAGPRIGIVGYGVVGRSLHAVFRDDAVALDADATDADRAEVNACDFVFLCVPMPVGPDGQCDTAIVRECINRLDGPQIVLRSTVAPGTTDRLRRETGKPIVFQPKYIGETPQHPLAEASAVADLYKPYYHSEVRFYLTGSLTAELAKYMDNAFYAAKVIFCNEFHDIATAHDVDYNELREIWLADPRISRDHTFVYPDNRGFSGKCLPKNLSAIIHASRTRGCVPRLLEAVRQINQEYRRRQGTYTPDRTRKKAPW
jgi:UDPglucose 6-dehydrogenase